MIVVYNWRFTKDRFWNIPKGVNEVNVIRAIISSIMKTFCVYLKDRQNPVVVHGDKAEKDNNSHQLTITKGNQTVGEFRGAELQGWSEETTS